MRRGRKNTSENTVKCKKGNLDSTIKSQQFLQFVHRYLYIYGDTYGISICRYCCSLAMSHSLRHGLQRTRLPVFHYLSEFVQTHVHRVDDAIQPSHWIYIAYRCVCTHTILLYLYQLTNLYSSQHGPIRRLSVLCDSNSASNCEHFPHQ